MSTETKTPKNFQKAPYSCFEQAAKILGIPHAELCLKLGYSQNTWSVWASSGQIPKVAQLALEFLCNTKPKTKEKIFLVRGGTKEQELKMMLKAFSLEFVEI